MTDPLNPPAPPPADPPTGTPAPPADPPTGGDGATDWEAKYKEATGHSRDWEKRAKANAKAAAELEELRKSAMTEQEKAVAEAEQRGRTGALAETGKKLAAAELRAALGAEKAKALKDVIAAFDMSLFLDEAGEPDTKKLAALAATLGKPAGSGSSASGGEFTGAPGTPPVGLAAQIAKAEADGDWKTARRLKSQLLTAPK